MPTRCIFCGASGPLTDEDYWPKWLQKYIPSPFKKSQHTTIIWKSNLSSLHRPHEINVTVNKKRGPLSVPLKIVCAKCNNGWMSRLQKRTAPYLKTLMQGEWHEFDEYSQLNVAAWAVMFTMVYDFRAMLTQNITQLERTTFKDSQTPPMGWAVSLGFMRNSQIHGKVKQRTLVIGSPGNAVPHQHYIQSTTLVAGRLLIHVYSGGFGFGVIPPQIESRLNLKVVWPAVNWPIRKPNGKISNISGFDFVANGISMLFQETVS